MTFEVEESERGPRAVNVVVVTGTEKIDPELEAIEIGDDPDETE